MTFKLRHLLLLFPMCVALVSPAEDAVEPQNDTAPAANPPSESSPPNSAVPAEQKPATVSESKSGASRSSASRRNEAAQDGAQGHDFTQDIMLQALSLIGVTYRWGGNSPETGLDCSGFIRYVFQQSLNIALPHNAFAISRLGEDVDRNDLKPGDLVFFNTLGHKFSHVGIYLGDDRFIHSPSAGSRIQIVSLKDAYWIKHFSGAKRVTQASVSERQPILAQLMAEERASEGSGEGRHGKHGRHSGHGHGGGHAHGSGSHKAGAAKHGHHAHKHK